MAGMMGRGYNSFSGFDSGPPPPPHNSFGSFSPTQSFPYGFQQPIYYQQPFFYPGGTHPSQPPTVSSYPGINIPNAVGGSGIEPGYNYLFGQDNCKVHVFKTDKAPWQMSQFASVVNPFDPMRYAKFIVPCNMTMQNFMKGIGCADSEPKKNVVHEISETGNGKWIKGMTFKGDDKDRMKKTISDFGWTKERGGKPGGLPVVWVWMKPA